MNSLALAIAFPLVLVVFCGSKRMALLAIAAGVLYLPQHQAVDVLGITLNSTRVFELAGFLRVLLRGETGAVQFNKIDRAFLLLYAYTTLVFLLRSETQQKEMIGTMVDAVFSYLTFRALIGDVEDVRWFLRRFLLCLVPFAGLLAVESQTGQNPFAVLGGGLFDMRDGRLRALGSFRNASSLGTLGASLLPLYVALAWDRDGRISGRLGVGIACAIVYFSNSGGPASAAAVGLLAWLAWPLRHNMRRVRVLLVLTLASLALAMQAPIWYLPARISSFSGGGGWHRSRLLEMAAEHYREWWLTGMDLSQTKGWFAYVLQTTDSADITNNFLAFGLRGGAVSILLLLLLLVRGFSALGIAMRVNTLPSEQKLLWGFGCMLTVHIASWFGISYFDQITAFWFLQLAMVAALFQNHLSPYKDRDAAAVSRSQRKSGDAALPITCPLERGRSEWRSGELPRHTVGH